MQTKVNCNFILLADVVDFDALKEDLNSKYHCTLDSGLVDTNVNNLIRCFGLRGEEFLLDDIQDLFIELSNTIFDFDEKEIGYKLFIEDDEGNSLEESLNSEWRYMSYELDF